MLTIIFQAAFNCLLLWIPFYTQDLRPILSYTFNYSFGPGTQNFILYPLILSFTSNETTIFTYQWCSQFSRQIAFTSPVHTTSHTPCRDFHEPAQTFFRCLFLKGYVSLQVDGMSSSMYLIIVIIIYYILYIIYYMFIFNNNFDLILLSG